MRRLAFGFLIALAALTFIAGVSLYALVRSFDAPGPAAEETIVILPRGAGLMAIAQELEQAGVVGNRYLFSLGVRVLGSARDLKAGEYAIPQQASTRSVILLLQAGRVVVHRLTVPEGWSTAQVVALVEAHEALAGAVTRIPPEGSLLPETYHFTRGETRVGLLDRMRRAQAELLSNLWPGRAPDLPFERPEEAIVLASVVEKETAVPAERARVAAVFINRLRANMLLQSDPTVIYALTQGKAPLGRPLTRADLETESPYNTYRQHGLPPAPIGNPGAEAIAAVLHPADTEELYFVADGSGGHVFSETYSEHRRNVSAWRRRQQAEDQ